MPASRIAVARSAWLRWPPTQLTHIPRLFDFQVTHSNASKTLPSGSVEKTMTRTIWALTFAAACSVAAAGQTPAADTAASHGKMMKGGPVTVTGCVAEAAAGQYTLTNATMANKGQEMSADKMPADKMPADKMNHPMTYTLSGATDLKAHVGHKVAVTGTMGKMDHMGKADAGDTAKYPAATADKAMKTATLAMTSVTMISATCP